MTRPARRSWLVAGAAALVVVLVGGRWLALETAERAWAASVPAGQVYVVGHDVARLVSGLILLLAVAWGTGNVFFVYRAIGSVQLPRRLGDLEIVEAVPQQVLLGGTLASGLAFGFLLALGTGDWWMAARLAARPPRFGVADPLLHRDLGYYVGQLPWLERLHGLLLLASVTATLLVALLYLGMGSLRFRRWLPQASAHARGHLGLLLAATALALAWGAALDPAETVAGLHGALDRAALEVRLPAAPLLSTFALVATLASLVWGLRDRPALLLASWGMLLGAAAIVYVVVPGVWRGAVPEAAAALAVEQTRLERLAFGADSLVDRAPPACRPRRRRSRRCRCGTPGASARRPPVGRRSCWVRAARSRGSRCRHMGRAAAAPAGWWPRCRTWTRSHASSRRRRGPTFTAAPGRAPVHRSSP